MLSSMSFGSIVLVWSMTVAVGDTTNSLSPLISVMTALPLPSIIREAPLSLTSERLFCISSVVPPLAMTVPSTLTLLLKAVAEPASRRRAVWPAALILRLSSSTLLFSPPALMTTRPSCLSAMANVPLMAANDEFLPNVMAFA